MRFSATSSEPSWLTMWATPCRTSGFILAAAPGSFVREDSFFTQRSFAAIALHDGTSLRLLPSNAGAPNFSKHLLNLSTMARAVLPIPLVADPIFGKGAILRNIFDSRLDRAQIFQIDRSNMVLQLRTLRRAIDEAAQEMKMVAAERVFGNSLSRALAREARKLHLIART